MAGGDYRGPAYETARLNLARIRVNGSEARGRAAVYAAQVSAEALQVERISIWFFRDEGKSLRCESLYLLSRGTVEPHHVVPTITVPGYLEALRTRRVLVVEDTLNDPLVAELRKDYLDPLGIRSLLNAPLIREGKVVGIVCHEHVGAPRSFEQREIDFACSVADLIALIAEQAERLELEAALQAQALNRLENHKMMALGRMARAVAHDINGLLTIAAGVGYQLDRAGQPELVERARELDKVVELGQKLTAQLLVFSGEERSEFSTTNLARVVRDVEPLLASIVKGKGRLSISLETDRTDVGADDVSVQQILLNLVQNATDALTAPSGHVTVRVREAVEDEGLRVGSLVVLEVEDDGNGMSDSVQARAFEPYFTTKRAGHGVGLATVFGLTQRFGGSVRIRSAPGKGTTVTVALARTLL